MSVMPVRGVVLYVGGRNGDTTLALFRGVVNAVKGHRLAAPNLRTHPRQRRRQGRLAVVYVAYRANIDVRL